MIKKDTFIPNPLDSRTVTTRRDFLQQLTRAAGGLALMSGLNGMAGQAQAKTATVGELNGLVNNYIKALRQTGEVAADERTAWSVYDFTSRKKLVSINENTPYQSASMIKPFIAQAYFYRHVENPQRYPYDNVVQARMVRMIRDSDNRATNAFINQISAQSARLKPKYVERLLKQRAGGIFRHTSIVEYIPKNGRTYRNKAAARDYSRFLYALWHNHLPFAAELRGYMGLPNEDRITDGHRPPIVQVFDKTGSTARLCGDMGIAVAFGKDHTLYPYTFIGIIEKKQRAKPYSRWLRARSEVLREVSALVYKALQTRYNLI